MNPTTIGILSDTHQTRITPDFQEKVKRCFSEVDIIIHAGDLTSPDILTAFTGLGKIHAVHGNMCDTASRRLLPRRLELDINGFKIGLIHKCVSQAYDFEAELLDEFGPIDCIIYGHTHRPVCHRLGETLIINPGAFMSSGRFGAPGTYAILNIDRDLQAKIYEVPRL